MYRHWRNSIYEGGLPQRQWLSFIAGRFDTVEVNTSFYRIPKPETVAAWAANMPEHFLFALKLWRGITHYRKLLRSRDLTERFFLSADRMPPHRRAPLLIQLPPKLKPDVGRLENYIAEVREFSSWRIAIEFREDDWLNVDTYRALDRLGCSVCLHDMHGRGAATVANDAPFLYVRRHGSAHQRYAGSYSPEAIEADAADIRRWTAEGRDTYVYYNNDIGGHAFYNALQLRQAL